MRSWARFLSIVSFQGLILSVIFSACVYRPRDEKVVFIESRPIHTNEEWSMVIAQFFNVHPSEDDRGYSKTELANLVARSPGFCRKLFGTDVLSAETIADVLQGMDRNEDLLLSPEELAKGLLDKMPLVAAMHGKGFLDRDGLEAFVQSEYGDIPQAMRDQMSSFLWKYDLSAFGGDANGLMDLTEVRTPSLVLHLAKRTSIQSLKQGLGMVTDLKPSERKFLGSILEYKIKQEGLNIGKISGWGNDGVFVDHSPVGPKGQALLGLTLLRLDQIDQLVRQGLNAESIFSYFYQTSTPPTDSQWRSLEGLYKIKTAEGNASRTLEAFLLLTDLEVADRFYQGNYAGNFELEMGLMYLFPKAVMSPAPVFRNIQDTVEHLFARKLTDHFFESYDADSNNRLDRTEFTHAVQAWDGDIDRLTYVFFNRSENSIDPSIFIQRGWLTLRPYIWAL